MSEYEECPFSHEDHCPVPYCKNQRCLKNKPKVIELEEEKELKRRINDLKKRVAGFKSNTAHKKMPKDHVLKIAHNKDVQELKCLMHFFALDY